jgi:BirA family transcriptional regulator, biotin operon repressor / biotin---[acetyl-CoA-carboxylase] ligase
MRREATDLAGVRHIAYDTLGSTSAEALALARAGERGPLWISARVQTAGRGRRGSRWVSSSGNLHATLLLSEPSSAASAPQLSFVAALAVHDSIANCAPQIERRLRVKWPNDLLIGRDKVSGILIEGQNEPMFSVAIGVGVNCANHPADTAYPATDLSAAGADISSDALIGQLAKCMHERIGQWDRGRAFATIRADWLKRAAGLGELLQVRLPERDIAGRFEGLDENGRLLLAMPEGRINVTAGEIFGFGGR